MDDHKIGASLIWDNEGHYRGGSWETLKQRVMTTQGGIGIAADDFIEMLRYRGAPFGPKAQTLREAFAELTTDAREEADIALLARILDIIMQSFPETQFEAGWFIYYIRDARGDFDTERAAAVVNQLYELSPGRTQRLMGMLESYVVDLDAEPTVRIVDLLVDSGRLNKMVVRFVRSARVFISYAREDNPIAERIRDSLSRYSQLQVWKDSQNLLPGHEWESEIFKSLEDSHYVLLCLSRFGLTKDTFFKREREWVTNEQIRRGVSTLFVVPARLDECEIPDELKNLHWVDLFSEWESGMKKIVDSILRDYFDARKNT